MLVRVLNDAVLQSTDRLEQLIGVLGVQGDRAVLKLVEGRIVGLVDIEEL